VIVCEGELLVPVTCVLWVAVYNASCAPDHQGRSKEDKVTREPLALHGSRCDRLHAADRRLRVLGLEQHRRERRRESRRQRRFPKFSQCMRSHGVPDFPDPSAGGGIHLSPGTNALSPAFKAAQVSCHKLLPGGGPGAAHPTAQSPAFKQAAAVCKFPQ
jgi:hypothetical protein